MSDSNVVNSEMTPSNLSDAEIESIISGGSVAGAPHQLAEFVADLQAEFAMTPGMTPGLALADFISAPAVAAGGSTAGSSTVTSIFKKSTAAAGAVSFKILLGAAAAAAGVGAAQAAGVIDLPGLGSQPTVVELPTDPGDVELGPPASVAAGGSSSTTIPAGRAANPVSVPSFAEPEQCTPTQGPTTASSTTNPSEANRQASAACNSTVSGQGNGSAGGEDDRGSGADPVVGDVSQGDNDQGNKDEIEANQSGRNGDQSSDSVNGAENEPKAAKSEQPDSPDPSGPKKEK